MNSRSLRAAHLVLVASFAFAMAACAEGAAVYESDVRSKSSLKWLGQQNDASVCWDKRTDLDHGFSDRLVLKTPIFLPGSDDHLFLHIPFFLTNFSDRRVLKTPIVLAKNELTCPRLLEASKPYLELSPVYELPTVDPQVLRLAEAVRWMNSNRDVHDCALSLDRQDAPAPWRLNLDPAREPHPSSSKINVRVLNCGESQLFVVVVKEIPRSTAACGQSEIPACGSSS